MQEKPETGLRTRNSTDAGSQTHREQTMLPCQEPEKELCFSDTQRAKAATMDELDFRERRHDAGPLSPALELVKDRHLASTATQVIVGLPDSELDLTDLPDLEKIPKPRATQSRAFKATNETFRSSINPKSGDATLKTDKALK